MARFQADTVLLTCDRTVPDIMVSAVQRRLRPLVRWSPVALAAPGAAMGWPSLRCRSCLTCVVVVSLVSAWACSRSRLSLVPGRLSVLVSACWWLRWWLALRVPASILGTLGSLPSALSTKPPLPQLASTSSRLRSSSPFAQEDSQALVGLSGATVPQHAPQATLMRPPCAVWFLSQGAPVASDLGVP